MLQAEIAIIDEAGHTEESMTIFGTGRVSLGMRGTGGYLHADEAETDLAVIVQDETHVSVDLKVRSDAKVSGGFRPHDSLAPRQASEPPAHLVFIEELRRWLEVRQLSINGVVVRSYERRTMMVPADPLASSLVRRAEASAAKGAVAVTSQLQRLREQGKIDDEGNVLVPCPDDMKPGSTTDL